MTDLHLYCLGVVYSGPFSREEVLLGSVFRGESLTRIRFSGESVTGSGFFFWGGGSNLGPFNYGENSNLGGKRSKLLHRTWVYMPTLISVRMCVFVLLVPIFTA